MGVVKLTEGQEVIDAEGNGDESSVRSPLLLDNQSANDEKQTRRVDIVDVVSREKRVVVARRGHGGAFSSPPWNHAMRIVEVKLLQQFNSIEPKPEPHGRGRLKNVG